MQPIPVTVIVVDVQVNAHSFIMREIGVVWLCFEGRLV
jgi:hypothetical protein